VRKNAVVSVVEADESVSWALARVIRSAGFAVEVFASAEQFIRSAHMARTACLVLDVQVPGMSGLQLQSHLAAAGLHIPIIFIITGPGDERSRTLTVELGAVNFQDGRAGEKALLKEIHTLLKVEDGEGGTSSMRSSSPPR
jgi:FixJ family two-component response regulator